MAPYERRYPCSPCVARRRSWSKPYVAWWLWFYVGRSPTGVAPKERLRPSFFAFGMRRLTVTATGGCQSTGQWREAGYPI